MKTEKERIEFERERDQLLNELKGKSFDEKVKWFKNNLFRVDGSRHELKYQLTGEDMHCFALACHQQDDSKISKDDGAIYEKKHLENLLRKWDAGNTKPIFNAMKAAKVESWIKYYKSLDQSKVKRRKYSYQWHGKPDNDLPELFRLLKDEHKLIAPETSLGQITEVFTSQDIENITPITWHDDNVSELLYFIDKLEKADLISSSLKSDYKRMTACFIRSDGEPFEASFKELKQKLDINLSSDKQNVIDQIVQDLR